MFDIGPKGEGWKNMEKPAGIVSLLFASLEKENIGHCLWKTNRILKMLTGFSDIDLLIDKSKAYPAEIALLKLGFKRFITEPWYRFPGVEDWIGCDPDTGKLIHVHLHYQILIGLRFVKEQRVPWEKLILETAIMHPIFNIYTINPALEVILMTLRAGAETTSIGLILSYLSRRFLPKKVLADQRVIRANVERDRVNKYLSRLFTSDYAKQLESLILDDDLDSRSLMKIKAITNQKLEIYRRYGKTTSILIQTSFCVNILFRKALKKLLHIPCYRKKRLRTDGLMIAVIGCDGAGKTTVIRELTQWLTWKIDAERIYLGSGRGLNKILFTIKDFIRRGFARKESSMGQQQNPFLQESVLKMIWRAYVAHRLYRLILQARKECLKGRIILTDRYPQNTFCGIYDGPHLKGKKGKTIIHQALINYENKKYERFGDLPPDIVIKLVVPAEIALQRKCDLNEDMVRKKAGITRQLSYPGARIIDIDASQPLDEVIRTAKVKVWELL